MDAPVSACLYVCHVDAHRLVAVSKRGRGQSWTVLIVRLTIGGILASPDLMSGSDSACLIKSAIGLFHIMGRSRGRETRVLFSRFECSLLSICSFEVESILPFLFLGSIVPCFSLCFLLFYILAPNNSAGEQRLVRRGRYLPTR
jgi:hypothetical protein